MTAAPADVYRARKAAYEAAAAAEEQRSRRLSRLRLLTAAAFVAALLALVQLLAWWAGAAAGLLLVVFVWLVVRHDRVEQRLDAARVMVALNGDALARIARDWDALPPAWSVSLSEDHPFASDLDVFGHASLVQVLGPVYTPTGRDTLARWILEPASADSAAIAARQEAARELAPALDFRQHAAALARNVPGVRSEDSALPHVLQWAEAPGALTDRDWVPWIAVVLAAATVLGAVGAFLGLVSSAWWLLSGTLGWGLRWFVHGRLEHAIGGAGGEHGLRPWAALIAYVSATRFTSSLLVQVRADLQGPHGDAPQALRALEQLVALSDARHSVWLYVPLQTLTLWDLHVWWAIERWRRRHGREVRRWLDAAGRVDALSALASVPFDHPDWAWPEFHPDADRIEASDAGHPLLSDAVRVCNDVVVGPPGRFLLITGSNMSGKSTLLRAIGLNVVLAHAGAPVCAARFRLPLLRLHTSMRVSDSLERGLSLFMASLVRLQQVVSAGRQSTSARRLCYLLDEVLQGTNSAERQVAVRTIMQHLLRCDAIGAVTTHDLELAADASFTDRADSFHLQETLAGSGDDVSMTFDYRLRPGPARSGNALQLLRMLGLADSHTS